MTSVSSLIGVSVYFVCSDTALNMYMDSKKKVLSYICGILSSFRPKLK